MERERGCKLVRQIHHARLVSLSLLCLLLAWPMSNTTTKLMNSNFALVSHMIEFYMCSIFPKVNIVCIILIFTFYIYTDLNNDITLWSNVLWHCFQEIEFTGNDAMPLTLITLIHKIILYLRYLCMLPTACCSSKLSPLHPSNTEYS